MKTCGNCLHFQLIVINRAGKCCADLPMWVDIKKKPLLNGNTNAEECFVWERKHTLYNEKIFYKENQYYDL